MCTDKYELVGTLKICWPKFNYSDVNNARLMDYYHMYYNSAAVDFLEENSCSDEVLIISKLQGRKITQASESEYHKSNGYEDCYYGNYLLFLFD